MDQTENGYLSNFSYLFVPFTTEDIDDLPRVRTGFTPHNGWSPVKEPNKYLHRYVFDKISSDTIGFRYRLTKTHAEACGLALGQWYHTAPDKYEGKDDVCFRFQIADVQLFAFQTSVCILAFELRYEDSDPFKIASAQYHLRKIAKEKIHLGEKLDSFASISDRLLQRASGGTKLDLFFYGTPDNERANLLTYVDVPHQEDYSRELYRLKWCYDDGFDGSDPAQEADCEDYRANENTIWGLSVSAAVCLVDRESPRKEFIEKKFQNNFRQQYLVTYVLLLHQKYMMYLFLTKMSVDIGGDTEELEKYKLRLYDFETHYMFPYISEVPQYQRLYARIRRVFALEEMFQCVQEPLIQLAKIQAQQAEKKEREQEQQLNTTLSLLSLLTIVSAITDAAAIATELPLADRPARIVQCVALAFVGVVSLITFLRLLIRRIRKDR